MKIKVTSVYVDDQDKALRFYTEILGFAKKTDFSQGPYRWLTVASPEEPDGTELQLALNNNPAAKRTSRRYFNRASPRPCFSPTTSRATTSGSRVAAPSSRCRPPM
jgi:catechol 2,3-dioxygenase-like lactoylglutathione lyase family enzyme